MFATHWIIGFVATDLDLFAIINWLAIIYSQVHDRFFIAKPLKRKAYPIFEEDDLLAKVKELDPNAACVLVDEFH